MKILFYDMGSYLYDDAVETLRDMGHKVRTVYYHFEDRYKDDFFCERFEKKVREIAPDLIFSINFFPLVAVIAHDHGLRYISWSCDSPLAEGLEEYFHYDTNRIWLFDKAEVTEYNRRGHDNVFYCPLAVNTSRVQKVIEEGRRGGELNNYRCDVSFVGSLYNASLEGIMAPLDDYLKGYLEGAMNAQMEFYGVDLLGQTITDEIIGRINARYRELHEKAGGATEGSVGETKQNVSVAAEGARQSAEGLRKSAEGFRKSTEGPRQSAEDAVGGFTPLNKRGLAFAIQKQITFAERVTLIDTLGSFCDMRFYSTKPYEFGSDVRFCGPVKYHSQMPLVFAGSKLNLCPTLRSIISGIPLRSLDILACGGVLMSNWQPELAEYFTDGEDLIMYNSLEEAVTKAQWYLEHEDELARIAGHATKVLEDEFSYRKMLEYILKDEG